MMKITENDGISWKWTLFWNSENGHFSGFLLTSLDLTVPHWCLTGASLSPKSQKSQKCQKCQKSVELWCRKVSNCGVEKCQKPGTFSGPENKVKPGDNQGTDPVHQKITKMTPLMTPLLTPPWHHSWPHHGTTLDLTGASLCPHCALTGTLRADNSEN